MSLITANFYQSHSTSTIIISTVTSCTIIHTNMCVLHRITLVTIIIKQWSRTLTVIPTYGASPAYENYPMVPTFETVINQSSSPWCPTRHYSICIDVISLMSTRTWSYLPALRINSRSHVIPTAEMPRGAHRLSLPHRYPTPISLDYYVNASYIM